MRRLNENNVKMNVQAHFINSYHVYFMAGELLTKAIQIQTQL